MRKEMEGAKKAMDAAEAELLAFKEKAQLAVLEKKIDILLERKGDVETGIAQARVAIAENVERLKKIEQEFGRRERTIRLSRKLAEDPLYQQSLAALSESDIKKIFNLSMEVEVADPTYQHLERKLVDVIPALSGLYAKKASLEAELEENSRELKRLQAELANKETELERLTRAYTLAVDTYKMFAKKYEEISIQVASMSQNLKVLDPAVIPDEPVRPSAPSRARGLIWT